MQKKRKRNIEGRIQSRKKLDKLVEVLPTPTPSHLLQDLEGLRPPTKQLGPPGAKHSL